MSLKIYNGTMIVLSDAAAVKELLDKRSASSNDRPNTYINNELITHNNHILLVNGPRSALFRKLFNLVLSKDAVPKYIEIQHAEGLASLFNILKQPQEFYGGT
jgi:cytochrome P450